MFEIRYQMPTWDTDLRGVASELSGDDAITHFEGYPWRQEFLARKHKLTQPTFVVTDLSDTRELSCFQFGSETPEFYLVHSRNRSKRFLRIFSLTRLSTESARDVDLPTANSVVRAFCSHDKESLGSLVPWQSK